MADVVEVKVFRSHKRANTYLYMPIDADYDDLPEALRQQMGQVTQCLAFELHASRRLAQAEASAVLSAIAGQGFYLQLPPNLHE